MFQRNFIVSVFVKDCVHLFCSGTICCIVWWFQIMGKQYFGPVAFISLVMSSSKMPYVRCKFIEF